MLDRASRFSLQGKRALRAPRRNLVLFLASPASDFVCGQIVFIDGGYSAV